MKPLSFKSSLLAAAVALSLGSMAHASPYTIPAGTTKLTVTLNGAGGGGGGGDALAEGGQGANGAQVVVAFTVKVGDVVDYTEGEAGLGGGSWIKPAVFPDGGNGGAGGPAGGNGASSAVTADSTQNGSGGGGGGGGASSVSLNGMVIAVAAGGGGGGGGSWRMVGLPGTAANPAVSAVDCSAAKAGVAGVANQLLDGGGVGGGGGGYSDGSTAGNAGPNSGLDQRTPAPPNPVTGVSASGGLSGASCYADTAVLVSEATGGGGAGGTAGPASKGGASEIPGSAGTKGSVSFVPTVVPPVITGGDLTTPVNTPISGSVGNAQVPPGVSYVLEGNPPANGQVTVDPVTGAYTYTPNKDYVGGPETFQIKACLPAPNDTLCSTATVTVTVTPAGAVTGAATPVPTLGHAAMALLGMLLAGLGWGAQRRKLRS